MVNWAARFDFSFILHPLNEFGLEYGVVHLAKMARHLASL